jgi:ABC-type transport system involved in cytochrome bd biosynthesis fused ATPase/permease subunit
MGETELMNGTLKMNGSLGFLSFKRGAFVSGTVRDNITLFGRYRKKLYEDACHIGNLNTARMPGDDFMMVSDSGGNLFAKEKMQILVARLVYQDPDIFIIDDFFDYLTPPCPPLACFFLSISS